MVDGFDNIGAGLLLDPSLLDKYLTVAKLLITDEVIVTGPPPAPTKTQRFEFERHGDERSGNYIPDGIPNPEPGVLVKKAGPTALTLLQGSGIEKFRQGTNGPETSCDLGKEMIPIEGEYALRIRAGAFRGAHPEPVKVRFVQGADGVNKPPVAFEVAASEAEPEVYEFRLHLKPGEPTGFHFGWNGRTSWSITRSSSNSQVASGAGSAM